MRMPRPQIPAIAKEQALSTAGEARDCSSGSAPPSSAATPRPNHSPMTASASSPRISSGAAPEDAPAHEHAAWPPLMNASRERYSIGSPSPARRAICAPGSCCLCQGPDRPTGRHGSRCSFPCLAPQWLTKAPSAGHLGATHWGHQHRQPSQAKLARATKPAAHPPRLFSSAPMQSMMRVWPSMGDWLLLWSRALTGSTRMQVLSAPPKPVVQPMDPASLELSRFFSRPQRDHLQPHQNPG